jgi:hypothetical protein
MATSKIREISARILRAADDLQSDVRLVTPNFGRGEPHTAEKELTRFLLDRGHRELTARDTAAFAFRVALAVLKVEKNEAGFEVEISDDAVMPAAHKPKGEAA